MIFGYVSRSLPNQAKNFLNLMVEATQTKEGKKELKRMGEEGKEIQELLEKLRPIYEKEKAGSKSKAIQYDPIMESALGGH